MLRRKLLIIFGSLVVMLGVMAAGAIWMLQGVLDDLHHIHTEAAAVVEDASSLNAALTRVEIDLYRLQLGETRHLDPLIDDLETARGLVEAIGDRYVVHQPPAEPALQALVEGFPRFERHVSSLATAQDAGLARHYNVEALALAVQLREHVRIIERHAREHARREHSELAGRFRWLVFGLALGSLLVINLSIIVLLRAAGMVLQPVDKLVEAGRRLSREQFDHRARLDGNDEFAEIAEAYNRLAEQLQSHEQRRMEMLRQVSLTLNHELNNAIETIELQLQLLGRQAGGDNRFESSLRRIHESLQRMARTVESLKHIRRIVLTDYISGVKMLDLERSVEAEPAAAPASSGSEQEGRRS